MGRAPRGLSWCRELRSSPRTWEEPSVESQVRWLVVSGRGCVQVPRRPGGALAAGFVFVAAFASCRYHFQARVTYIEGEFPFWVIDVQRSERIRIIAVLFTNALSCAIDPLSASRPTTSPGFPHEEHDLTGSEVAVWSFVFQRLPRLLMAVALACSVGLHWSLLQSFAWTTMLVNNLTTASFSTAVQRTFDGQHPCALCKAVAEGRKSEKKSDTLPFVKKFEWLNNASAIVVPRPASFPEIHAHDVCFETLLRAPPTPPPRAA